MYHAYHAFHDLPSIYSTSFFSEGRKWNKTPVRKAKLVVFDVVFCCSISLETEDNICGLNASCQKMAGITFFVSRDSQFLQLFEYRMFSCLLM
jgi:hypothetical protein